MRTAAFTLFCGVLFAASLAPRSVCAAEVAISEEARTHFAAGVNFLQDPDGARYNDAYSEFKAAYAASPSWKILGNLGLAAMKLERDGEAIEAFSKYLAEGGKELERDERQQVERDLKTLQAGVVMVSLSFAPAGGLLTDERVPVSGSRVVNRYGPVAASTTLGVRPGHHRFSVELDGYEEAVWEFDAAPREQLQHDFALTQVPEAPVAAPPVAPAAPLASPPPPTQERSGGNALRTGSYIAFGVGAVGLGLGTVFALSARSKYKDANALCASFPCELTQAEAARRESLGSDGDSAKTLSVVGFVAGGLGVAAGVTLFVLSGKKQGATESATLAPFVGPGAAGVRGSF